MGDPEPTDHGDTGDAPPQPPAGQPPVRVFTSQQLFGDLREIWIQHGDVQYRLRITSTDKLVLTK